MPRARRDTESPERPIRLCCISRYVSGVLPSPWQQRADSLGDMKLGLNLGYWGAGNDADNIALAQAADRIGYSVV